MSNKMQSQPAINRTKALLQRGGVAASFSVSRLRGADTPGIAHACGFPWLFIDQEHNPISLDDAADMCAAALAVGITPIVRVPGHEHHHASRALDGGAQGIVVPHIDTVEEARAVVRSCMYPPAGNRSLTGALPHLGFNPPTSLGESMAAMNAQTLVIVMVETEAALANVNAIAAVDGVDVLMVGSNDLAADMGIPGDFRHPRMRDAYRRVVDACRAAGKFAGMGGIYDEALMRDYVEAGVRFLLGGADIAFMMAAAKQRAAFLRTLQPAGMENAA